MTLKIEFDGLNQLYAELQKLPVTLDGKARQIFLKRASELYRTMVSRSMRGPLHARTGDLGRSWHFEENASSLYPIAVSVYTKGVPYAWIQEKGGTIKPKKGQFLTIPLTANKTAAGVARIGARQAISAGAFFHRTEKGGLIIAKKDTKGSIIPLFALVKSVKIPARLGFEEQAKLSAKQLIKDLDNLMGKGV